MTTLPRRCLGCGVKIRAGSRCARCQAQVNAEHDQRKGETAARGYDSYWQRLVRAAIKLHPWCTDCGMQGTPGNPLTGDHLRWPALTLDDIAVVCRRCNSRRGARRKLGADRPQVSDQRSAMTLRPAREAVTWVGFRGWREGGPEAGCRPVAVAVPVPQSGRETLRSVLPALHNGAEGPRGAETAAASALAARPVRLRAGSGAGIAADRLDLPRGQGKTTAIAALGLYDLLLGAEGASIVVAACDERQAGLCFNIARRMVELHPGLESRVQVFQDKLVVPSRDATFQVLPAVPKRLEGLDFTLAILDEFGRIDREVYEVVGLASGKRASSLVLGIGTPGPDWATSVLADMREYAIEHPEDPSLVWREHSAAGFEDHPVDCRHCWELASPALGDFLSADGIAAFLPPKTRESTFRRSRLCQFSDEVDNPWLPPRAWEACALDRPVPDGAEVVLALDGSFSQDATALVVCQIGDTPHLDVEGLWEPPADSVNWRTPILDVEQAIRDCCRRRRVLVIVCDPFRWQRTLQVLLDEGQDRPGGVRDHGAFGGGHR
jgi:Terminase large subunit, ATPase domain